MWTIIQWIGMLTGTWDGNASLVMHWILLLKFIADVLHSSALIQKWSRTSKVDTVWGFLKQAGKSLTQSRSWTYWSNDLVQWHHQTERLKIPVDDTTIRLDCNWNCVLQPSEEFTIPHLHMMERYVCVSRHTAEITLKIGSKAILTLMCGGYSFTVRAWGS